MGELAVNNSLQPITLDGKMAENEGGLQNVQTYKKKSFETRKNDESASIQSGLFSAK
ncbi:hypothetical protein [Bacillus wiedmannii]|uniref:hypothetical protein n=1 Tax=Bacillus wiedmannii TaxID=1890302 RepID=UPI00211D2363|nr:hypothetical protein [Bacillus wiedmannii]